MSFLCAVLYAGGLPAARADDADPATAFESFVIAGDLKSAHFYLENKLLPPERIETSRLFVRAVMESNVNERAPNPFSVDQLPSIELLYNYLGAIKPIELNGLHKCVFRSSSYSLTDACTLASFLFQIGAKPEVFAFFQKRGMTTVGFSRDTAPPVMFLVGRLGVDYGLTELNWFAENGAPLGAETYTREQLTMRNALYPGAYVPGLKLPADKPATSAFNYIDLLTLSLANSGYDGKDLNRHRDFLCRYIAHVAGQMAPTFDHFSFLLRAVDTFRGGMIDRASHPEQWGSINTEVFPHSCRLLIEAMGRSSLQLDAMINEFSAAADLETARWLVSLKQSKGDPNAQSN